MIGKQLASYEILEKVGAGGMGEVYRARDSRLDRIVAIKTLPPQLAEDAELRARFEREAKTISSLSHPDICALYDFGNEDGVDYLVLEFLEGEPLSERLQKGPLPVSKVLEWGARIADALGGAHRQGVVHRDLKPANVMITPNGPKLLDFGLAKPSGLSSDSGSDSALLTRPQSDEPLTTKGTVLGTFHYMAPEQLEGQDADARSDIFALGAVLYEMASGKKPFDGASQASVIAAVLERGAPPLSEMMPLLPAALSRTIHQCLEKDPSERWQSAEDVARELRWISTDTTRVDVTRPTKARRPWRERTAWAVALASSIAVSILAARGGAPPDTGGASAVRTSLLFADSRALNLEPAAPGPPVLSPDGRHLAFVSVEPQGPDTLWVRNLATESVRPLATAEVAYPFWSPDSREIAYFDEGVLRRVDISSGASFTISSEVVNGKGGAWGADGRILYAPSYDSPLVRIPVSGGQPDTVTTLSSPYNSHRHPRLLPDGRHFLFFARSDSGTHVTFVGDLDGDGEPRVLLKTSSQVEYAGGYLLFVRHNAVVAQRFDVERAELIGDATVLAGPAVEIPGAALGLFSVTDDYLVFLEERSSKDAQLVWRSIEDGRQLGTIGDPGPYGSPSVSPDGSRVAVTLTDPETDEQDVWILDGQRGLRTRITFDEHSEAGVTWAPDGNSLWYASNAAGRFAIYRKSLTSVAPAELILENSEFSLVPSSASRDGRWLVYGRENNLWLLQVSDGTTRPFLELPSNLSSGGVSPDGTRLVFSWDESGVRNLYLTSFPEPGSPWRVTTDGAYGGGWGDDNMLIFIDQDTRLNRVLIVEEGGALRFEEKEIFALPMAWGGDMLAGTERFLLVEVPARRAPAPATVVSNWQALVGN